MRSFGWKNCIFNSYEELPSLVGDHNTDEWAKKQCDILDKINESFPTLEKRNSLLIDSVNNYHKDKVVILDFAGGIGLSYSALRRNTDKQLEYHIVEVPLISQRGNKIYESDPSIHFHTDIADAPNEVDVVHIRTSIQYVEDWKSCIERLLDLNPKIFLMPHISAGNIPTYLTLQLWGESQIPYWFLNIEEIKQTFSRSDYKCFLESKSTSMKEDKIGWDTYKMFPEEYRIDYFLNMGFKK